MIRRYKYSAEKGIDFSCLRSCNNILHLLVSELVFLLLEEIAVSNSTQFREHAAIGLRA